MTIAEHVAALNAVPSVLEAYVNGTPGSIQNSGLLYHAKISWYYLEDGVAKPGGGDLIVLDLGVEGQEVAYWVSKVPTILEAPAEPETYITDRNTPFTAAQIQAFSNTLWKAQNGNAQAGDIIGFSVSAVNGKTIRVSGYFDVAGVRERRSYLLWLVDPNGLTSGSNLKFERVVE